MKIPYRHAANIAINQHLNAPSSTRLEASPGAILLLPPAPAPIPWDAIPYGDLLRQRWAGRASAAVDEDPWVSELPNPGGTRLAIARIPSEGEAFEQLTQARKLAAELLGRDPSRVLVCGLGLDGTAAPRAYEAVIAALLAGVCALPSLKSAPSPAHPLKRIDCYGLEVKLDLRATRAEAQGNHLARWLTHLPPNLLAPRQYRAFIDTLVKHQGWTLQVLDKKSLARKKAGAFLAVAQASSRPDAAIVHLGYRPPGARRRPSVALIGKGICFDTGGVNLKSARFMHGMHEDMEGSAVALGTLLALTLLEVDFAVDCWLALAENHVGPAAYKPNDVITASNGTSIEIVHTDAEGRMILADTLALAGKTRPRLMIDYATLTGACVAALSTRLSGVFCNRDALLPTLIEAGRASGERVWPFPMSADFDEALESKVADIKQCTLDSEADHILAARFLSRFVPQQTAWIHMDLSAGNHKRGLAHIPTDVTGFGVRFTLNLLLQQQVLSQETLDRPTTLAT